MSFAIFVDSAGNIPAETAKEYNIEVVSFVNEIDGKEVVCFDPSLSPLEERVKGKTYYDFMRKGGRVHTSLVNSQDFMDAWTPFLKKGEDILYYSLSKNISGTFNAARIAAEELLVEFPDRRIEVVDSLTASLGQGLLAIYASIMRKQGKSFSEAFEVTKAYVPKMISIFTTGELTYLARTGRIKNYTAAIGNMLGIKPILKGSKEGEIVVVKKIQGRKNSINELVDLVVNNIVDPENQILGIAHADDFDTTLAMVAEIKNRTRIKDVIITSYDYCTGSHVGPDTIALFFLGKDRELQGPARETTFSFNNVSIASV